MKSYKTKICFFSINTLFYDVRFWTLIKSLNKPLFCLKTRKPTRKISNNQNRKLSYCTFCYINQRCELLLIESSYIRNIFTISLHLSMRMSYKSHSKNLIDREENRHFFPSDPLIFLISANFLQSAVFNRSATCRARWMQRFS